MAEQCCAFAGHIVYTSPVTGSSDLEVVLLFESSDQARNMETRIIQAVRDQWNGVPPMTTVSTVAQKLINRVFADHYDRSESRKDRMKWEHAEKGRRSAKTTVMYDDEFEKESVVDRHKTSLKFKKCHIDATIKNSKNDTTGNHNSTSL